MSRALARLREATGDPLLVRAGRGLVPTPRALELRDRVGQLVQDAEAALRPADRLNLARLDRTFTLRTSDGFVENFGADLVARVGGRRRAFACASCRSPTRTARRCARGRSIWKPASSARRPVRKCARRRCSATASSASCARDTRWARARSRPPATPPDSTSAFRGGPPTRARSTTPWRRSACSGGRHDRRRLLAALALARASDLVATVPERHTGDLRAGMHSFALPLPTAGDHGLTALASADGCRSGASLAAGVRSGGLRRVTGRDPPATGACRSWLA